MADNFIANPGSGGDTFAADDVGGVKIPRSKLVIGADGVNDGDVSASNPLPTLITGVSETAPLATQLYGTSADYWPGYTGTELTGPQAINVDPDGGLITRGSVLTDEGTFRVNFANTSLAVALGSVTISGDTVTGTGFMTDRAKDVHYSDYFKLDADGESAWVQIDQIVNDTTLKLVSNYVGGTSGAASRALVQPVTGSGGSISVASGACTIAAGTTINSSTLVRRSVDYAPLVFRAAFSVSQRIVNQTIYAGMSEPATATPKWFARFRIDGTTNTTVICETARNPSTTPSAAETQTTTVTVPNGLNTATSLEYRVELLTERVVFFINGVRVAEHSRVIPAQHDEMQCEVRVTNGGVAPASNTNIVVDFITGKNHNKLEIGVMSDAEGMDARQPALESFPYSVAGVIVINTDLLVIDCNRYKSLLIQCTSMGTTGVVTPAWSSDGVNWVTATLFDQAGASSTTFNAAVMRVTNVMARYFRLRLTTATTAGTTTIRVDASQQAVQTFYATQPVSGTVGVTGYPTAAAAADAFANPTITHIGADSLLFNGTTWDRARNNLSVAVDTSSARTTSGTGVTFTNFNGRQVIFWINVTAVSGTTPTMTVRVQWSPDNGTTWIDMDTTNLQTASITATGNFQLRLGPGLPVTANLSANIPAPRLLRLAWTISGTTPSFTFVSWANSSN